MAVFMENNPKYMVVFLALAKIGVTSALINNHLTQEVILIIFLKNVKMYNGKYISGPEPFHQRCKS